MSADWIEAQVADAPEHDETIGWHLEQAHQHLRELGTLDAHGRSLGERAAGRLAVAGRRALAGDDVALAAGLLGRAIERLDADDAARADLTLDWCEALLAAGDVGAAAKAIDELGRFIEVPSDTVAPLSPGAVPRADGLPPFQGSETLERHAEGQQPQRGDHPLARGTAPGDERAQPALDSVRLRAWHTCFTGQLTALTAPQKLQATVDAVAAAAEELAKLGDDAGQAKAYSVHAQALARLGRVGACEAALDRALAAARKAGDRRRVNAVLAGAPLAALWGPSPLTRASGRCLDVVRVLRITQGAPAVEAVALSCQGVLEALRGRTDAARRMIASSRRMVEELGIAHRVFETDVFAGRIDLLEGDAAAAERSLRGAYEGLRDLGLGIDAARAAALLARALLAQGKVAEAEGLSHESEQLAGDDLQATIAWRGVRAQALAQRGEQGKAVEMAQAAVSIASATDALLDHADARLALAATLRAARRHGEADAEERHAIELWEAKGAMLLAKRARRAPGPEVREGEPRASRNGSPGALPSLAAARSIRRPVRTNAGSAAMARIAAALAARDLNAMAAEIGDSFEEISHPTGTTYGREAMLFSVERFMGAPGARARHELLATLGDRLWLFRRWMAASAGGRGRFDVAEHEKEEIGVNEVDEHGLARRNEVVAGEVRESGGPLSVEHLQIDEIDSDGQFTATIAFDRDDLEAAYAELDARWAAGEAATHPMASKWLADYLRFFAARDWTAMTALCAPDLVGENHRLVGWGSLRGPAAIVSTFQAQIELAPDTQERVDHVRTCERAVLFEYAWHGTREGGTFENLWIVLIELDPDGRARHAEVWEAEQLEQARARFAEVAAGGVGG